MSRSSYHDKAPISAAFVKEMRALFGEVRVLYVKEGEVNLGERQLSIQEYIDAANKD